MAARTSSNLNPDPARTSTTPPETANPRFAFRSALGRYPASKLKAITQLRGLESEGSRASTLAAELTEQLDSPSFASSLLAGMAAGSRMALSLFAITETNSWPMAGLQHSLATLGVEPASAIVALLERGILALAPDAEAEPVEDFQRWIEQEGSSSCQLLVHPSVPQAVRSARPEGTLPHAAGPVSLIRESDGLEPILRLGALWQRVGAEPLRQTQQGTLYKRDRERLEEDTVVSGTISDALEPLSGIAWLWLALARRVRLITLDSSGERLLAAPPDFWSENAVHLPQMVATGWLGLRDWREWQSQPGEAPALALPFLRPAVLLWLATLADDEWVAIDDLADHLQLQYPAWDSLGLPGEPAASTSRRAAPPQRKSSALPSRASQGRQLLGSLLLGAGYALGLVRAAEERGSGRTVVQLTPLGRYVLALGPPPPPRPTFDHFLFVQPNFEMIAYRQGLTPQILGRLSRFAWWTKIGAALELKLTQESILFGLEGGQTPDQMLEVLTRHSQRALPSGVTDAVKRWASRRDRITFYQASTLVEFGSRQDRDLALAHWESNGNGSEPKAIIPVADRFLLVEDPKRIPLDRIRMSGSRDYRLPPEVCVNVEADGVTLSLDPARSDLLIDAELARLADEIPAASAARSPEGGAHRRRFVVSSASLSRAAELGMTPAHLADWYSRRTGDGIPPAIKLLLKPGTPKATCLKASRMLVLNAPSAELLDGLLQHPATRPLLGDRLGPMAVVIPEPQLESLQRVLLELGIELDLNLN